MDVDVVDSSPRLAEFEAARNEVARANNISPEWINDGAKGFADYLPDDFRDRLIRLGGEFMRLRVSVLSRADLIVMKLAAFRPEDIQDVSRMAVTAAEASVVRAALHKIARFDAAKAHVISLFLEEKGLC